jgi:hypothetical protein
MTYPDDWFTRKVRPYVLVDDAGCWLWQRGRDSNGYGHIRVPGVGARRVHRVVYEHLVGPIPTGLHIDHLCRVTTCCRPDHLEPVTQRVNTLRGATVNADHAQRTHCPRGHELAGENLAMADARLGWRKCATCQRKAAARKAADCRTAYRMLGLTRREYANRFGWSAYVAREIIRRIEAGEPLDGVHNTGPGSGRWGPVTITAKPDPTRA